MRTRFQLAALILLLIAGARPALAARVDGANVHWTSAGSGPAIVFVHGWTCDESSWQGQVPAFSQKYRVITLDRRIGKVGRRTASPKPDPDLSATP